MKGLAFLLSFFFCVILSNFSFSQDVYRERIYLESTDFDVYTNVRVSCAEFEKDFAGRIKVKDIEDVDTIQRLNVFLQKIKYSRKGEDIDTRAKFVYDKGNGEKIRICMSKFDIVVDGRLVKHNVKFFSFLRRLTM